MKIICAGFWKTGTKSMAHALRILGYKVYDYDDQMLMLPELWIRFFNGTVTDAEIRDAFKDVDVIIDGPAIACWEEIHRAIPHTQIILTTRDEDSWWRSYKNMICSTPFLQRLGAYLMIPTPTGGPFLRTGIRCSTFCIGAEDSSSYAYQFTDNPRLYKLAFRRHNSHVLQSVRKDKLLVHNVGDGWRPLCNFLGKDIPDIDYPHKNKDGAHFTTEGGPQNPRIKRIMLEIGVVFALLIVILLFFLYQIFIYFF